MQTSRVLGVLVPLTVLVAATWWFVASGGGDGAAPTVGGEASGPEVEADPEVAPARSNATPGEAPGRSAVASGEASGPASAGAAGRQAVVGRVVDDTGVPLSGAEVSCVAAAGIAAELGGPDGAEFDFELEPQAMAERFRAREQQRVAATTDGEGRFRLVPSAGASRTLELRARLRSHVVLERNADRPAAADVDLGTLTLKRGAVVTGRVLDRQNQPVVGARVTRQARNEGGANWDLYGYPGADVFDAFRGPEDGMTNAQGEFELAHVAPGAFSLRARHPDRPPARLEGLTAEAGKSLTNLLIVAELGEVIRGRLVGVPAGTKNLRVQASVRPVEGSQPRAEGQFLFPGMSGDLMESGMAFGERSAELDAELGFVLRGLTVGRTYRVWATQGGRGFAGAAACTQRVEVTAGTTGVELLFDPGVTVTFRAVRGKTETPVETLWVREQLKGAGGAEDAMGWVPRANRSREYPDGRVTIGNLRPKKKQTLTLTVDARGFARLEQEGIALPATGVLDLGTLRLQPVPLVHVTVTAAQDGTPLAGATVRVVEREPSTDARPTRGIEFPGMGGNSGPGTARTDAEGRCALNARPGARIVIAVTTREFAPFEGEPFAMPSNEDARQDVRLVRGGSVQVTVAGPDGASVADARVEHRPPFGSQGDGKTSAAGQALFERLTPGQHRFRLGGRGGSGGMRFTEGAVRFPGGEGRQPDAGWEIVEVVDGAQASLRLTRQPSASLRGFVRDNGTPLAGARIALVEGAGTSGGVEGRMLEAYTQMGDGGRSTRTGEDGGYVLKDVPAGPHRLRVTHKDRAMPATVAVNLHGGENLFDVELDTAVLRGTVKDLDGKPVPGATVTARPARTGRTGGEAADARIRMVEEMMPGLDFGGGRGNAGVKTGADGGYELRGVEPGVPLQVRATAKGFAAAVSDAVTVERGGTRSGVDVKLNAAGSIKVTASGAAPFSSVRATFEGEGAQGIAPTMQMLRNGTCTLEGLRPGRWRVELLRMGGEGGVTNEPRVVEVAAGETANVAF